MRIVTSELEAFDRARYERVTELWTTHQPETTTGEWLMPIGRFTPAYDPMLNPDGRMPEQIPADEAYARSQNPSPLTE